MKKLFLVTLLAVLFVGTVAYAQQQETLTVQGLINMKAAGADENFLIAAIQTADAVDIPADSKTLKAFKDAGISQKVAMAVLERKKNGTVNKISVAADPAPAQALAPTEVASTKVEEKSFDSSPSEEGVFAKQPKGWKEVNKQSTQIKGSGGLKTAMLGSVVPFAGPGVSTNYTYSGKEAALKVSSSPEFLVRDSSLSANEIVVVRLEQHKKERTYKSGGVGRFGTVKIGADPDTVVSSANISKLESGVFLIKFGTSLEPGEYAIGLRGDMPRYDFSVVNNTQLAQQE